MLPTHEQLRAALAQAIADRAEQGHVTDGLDDELASLGDSYDRLIDFAEHLHELPLREDWPYEEPDDLAAIERAWDVPHDSTAPAALVRDAQTRVRAAFLARVCGCMLGKPFEVDVSLDEIRRAIESNGEWPLADYASEAALRALPRLQGQWRELARELITHVAPDDDINYTILAMLALEQHGTGFTHEDMRRLWMLNLPVLATFGPERTRLVSSALESLEVREDVRRMLVDPRSEYCGAMIRADAYGYAAFGRPALAARLAHRDASFTHRRTGIYAAMFIAASIAAAPLAGAPLEAVREGLRFVPKRSRFAERTRECFEIVERADDWLSAYREINGRFGEYGHCRIYQETGTLINTLRFAADTGEGICMQVMQGNDTDSFGATAGSILGASFGPDGLDERWTRPFNDDVHTALALFHERSLDAIAGRMSRLPELIAP